MRFPFHRQGHQGYGKAVSSPPSPSQPSGRRVAPETRGRSVALAVTLPGLTPPGGERRSPIASQPTSRAPRPTRSPAATGARLVAPWRRRRGKFPGRGALFTVSFCSAGARSSQASPAIETRHAGRGQRGGQRGRRAGSGPGRPRLPYLRLRERPQPPCSAPAEPRFPSPPPPLPRPGCPRPRPRSETDPPLPRGCPGSRLPAPGSGLPSPSWPCPRPPPPAWGLHSPPRDLDSPVCKASLTL